MGNEAGRIQPYPAYLEVLGNYFGKDLLYSQGGESVSHLCLSSKLDLRWYQYFNTDDDLVKELGK